MPILQTTRVSLLARLGTGSSDPSAWPEFVGTYGPAVIAWCKHHGLQDSDAEDVAQDVLFRFWRHSERFRYDPLRRFRGYLRRMVMTAVADWGTARALDRQATGDDAVQGLLRDIPARVDLARRIEDAFDHEALAIAMREVEARVLPQTWQAFRLLAIERLSGDEVAGRLGIEVNHAYRARSRVQGMIREVIRRLELDPVEDQAPTS